MIGEDDFRLWPEVFFYWEEWVAIKSESVTFGPAESSFPRL